MSFQLPFGVRVLNPQPVENKYFNTAGQPYTGTSQVLSQLSAGVRHVGLTVNVNGEEYWFKTGTTNGDLVLKIADVAEGGGITGATNGLTKVGANVKLGGTLTDDYTEINRSSNNFTELYTNIEHTSSSANTYVDLYSDNGYAYFDIRSRINDQDSRSSINGDTDGLYLTYVKTTSDNADISLNENGIFVTLNGTAGKMEYSADYSANFTPRSLVDKAYVTGLTTTSGVQTANNGLTKSGTNVRFGGTLTGDTILDLGNSYANVYYGFGGNNITTTLGTGSVGSILYQQNNVFDLQIYTAGDSGGLILRENEFETDIGQNALKTGIYQTPTYFSFYSKTAISNALSEAKLQDNQFTVTLAKPGSRFAGYAADYSSDFTSRSFVDKAYVTGLTSGLQTNINNKLDTSVFNTYTGTTAPATYLSISNFNTYSGATDTRLDIIEGDITDLQTDLNTLEGIAVTAATNGLNKPNGNTVALGGALTQNTIVNVNNFQLDLSGTTGEVAMTIGSNHVMVDNSGVIVQLEGTDTFRYAADYSTNYVDRSLVDKAYVDNVAAGLDVKEASHVATTSAITGTYVPTGGSAGTGSFTGVSTTVVDGHTIENGDRILVKNQADPRQNGIYVRISSSVWERAEDQNGVPSSEVSPGNFTFVTSGSTLAGTGWIILGTGSTLTLNVDDINWTQFNAATLYTGGQGIVVTGGTVINVDLGTNSGLFFDAGQLEINPTIAGDGLTFNAGVLDVGAANGLTALGDNVVLGGTLTGNTTINTNDDVFRIESSTFAFETNNTGTVITDDNELNLGSSTGGDTRLDGSALFIGNLGAGVTFEADAFTLDVAQGTITTADGEGLKYGVDYSSTFVADSLVTKQYVDDALTNDITANNGLTKTGTNVRLGGTLTGNTTIVVTGGTQLYHDWSDNFGTNGFAQIGGNNFRSFETQASNPSWGETNFRVRANDLYSYHSNSDGDRFDDLTLGEAGFATVANYQFGDYARLSVSTPNSNVPQVQIFTYDSDSSSNNYANFVKSGFTFLIQDPTNTDVAILSLNTGATTYRDGRTVKTGIQYAADYSTGFTNLSLVHKGYVTGLTTTSGVQTANNGLTKSGTNVRLGGTLTGDTTIDGSADFTLDISSGGVFINTYDGNIGLSNSSNNNDILITSSGISGGTIIETQGDNGFIQIKTLNLQLDLTNTEATFTDSRTGTTAVGIEYNADYSANFTPRSLVDKAYVTGLTTTSGVQTANNGLTKSGTNVRLGGTLTGYTTIDGNGQGLDLINMDSGVFIETNGGSITLQDNGGGGVTIEDTGGGGVYLNDTTGGIYLESSAGGGIYLQDQDDGGIGVTSFNSSITIEAGDLANTGGEVYIGTLGDNNNGIWLRNRDASGTPRTEFKMTRSSAIFTDGRTGTTAVGLQYAADYSANFTPRSLVDKGYVTGLTSNIQINKLAVAIASANYTATTANHVILVDTTAARTITLPASPVDGQVFHIKDKSGSALTNNITIAGNGNNIDGAGTASINTDYGSLYIVYSSTEDAWFSLAFIS